MRDLAISPLRFWHRHINPNRVEEEPTPEMEFGSALHCAILEPEEFEKRYGCGIDYEQHASALDTIDDLRKFLTSKGHSAKGTKKADIIAQVQAVDPMVPILSVLEEANAKENAGKVVFKAADWYSIGGAAMALREERAVQNLLRVGKAEVPLFGTDADFGVPLKARLDWMTPEYNLDLKTFSLKREKPIDKTVTDAIFNEGYHRQGYIYSLLRSLQPDGPGHTPFILVFVQSEEPYEIRIRKLMPKVSKEPSLLWTRAMIDVRGLLRTYSEYRKKYGEKPWRDPREVDPLVDEEFAQLSWS